MLVLRPVTMKDHAELLAMAKLAGIGMTSLPADSHVLDKKIARAEASFSGAKNWVGDEAFLFVLEDVASKKIIGTTGIVAHVGVKTPFYSYKLSTIVQAYAPANIYSRQRVLHMVNDYTGVSEIGSLFLLPDYRRDGIGSFLSRARFLMMAEFPELFSDRVIAEIRGVQNENGESPFYQNLAQHFFGMSFQQADFIWATQGSQFISDLMPKYPIYVNLLHAEAQAVIGQPMEASKGAMHLLEKEGFINQDYIDLFDAGPTMQIQRTNITTVKNSQKLPVSAIQNVEGKPTHMLSFGVCNNFCMTLATLESNDAGAIISADVAAVLGLKVGDEVRVCKINA